MSFVFSLAPVEPNAETHDFYIRCNGGEMLINTEDDGGAKLTGEWDSEPCEGCGEDIVETGIVRLIPGFVRCSACRSVYPIQSDRKVQS